MKNTIKYLLFTILFFNIVPLVAQEESFTLLDSVEHKFSTQLSMFPQEKIYVQIDKSYYIAGEDIWFRAHLVNALLNLPDTTSRYIYSELINPIDSVISRVKIRPQDGAYNGHISLAEDLPEGEYLLRFYTRFQEGLGDNYFFKRIVKVGDPLGALYRTNASFEYEDNGNKIKLELRITDTETDKLIKPNKISITDNRGIKELKADEDNVIKVSIDGSEFKRNKAILLEYDYSGKFHKQFINVPLPDDYEVTLLPEGGALPLGSKGRIAFKALNSQGLGEDITGAIVSEKGDTLSYVESKHKGMGFFMFQSDNATDNYSFVCKNKNGLEKKYNLPKPISNTVSLNAQWQRDRLFISVVKSTDIPQNKELFLILQCRGVVLNASEWDNTKEFLIFPKDILPSGVIQILLVDSEMNPLSERLIFSVNPISFANITFSTDKQNYAKREKVNASFNLLDIEGNPAMANVSVSVTDDNDVKPDTCVNILSALLLTSELKGNIESPAYYFSNINYETASYLDILMMTQGWSRYDVSKILKGNYDRPKSFLELGPEISGTVKGGLMMNKPAANYPITLISNQGGIFDSSISDGNGRFRFNGFEMPDSITYIVQGQTKKGGSRVELTLDPETFPAARFSIPFLPLQEDNSDFEDYLEKADQQFVMANGMRMIYLKDVEVTAKAKPKPRKSTFSSPMNPRFTLEEIESFHAIDIFSVLSRFAGVMVTGKSVSIRGGGTPLVLLDGLEIDMDFVQNIDILDVDEIEVVKDGTAAIFGLRGSNGVILIATKRGDGVVERHKEIFNVKRITPLGYQTTKEFYSPQYETRQQRESANPDLRTTIYWNPSVKSEEGGKSDFSFYTSDASSTTYSVVIEGVTSNGLLIHTIKEISRKD